MTTVSSSTASTASTSSSSSSSGTTIFSNFNTFLTLLTTQLKNQDPSSPMDTDQFTQQLVQYASVEQLMSANETLSSLLSLQESAQVVDSASLVGKTIEVESNSLALQNGSASLRLPEKGTYSSAVITVTNGSGSTVHTETVALGSDSQVWTWDGKSNAGAQLADGSYKVTVTGTNSAGATGNLDFTVIGKATSVQMDSDKLKVSMGDLTVDYDKIVQVAE